MYSTALVFAALTYLYATSVAAHGLTVNTSQGQVTGSLVLPGVRQWLGIPFATADRWEAPGPPPARTTPLLANAYGKSCYQLAISWRKYYLGFAHQDDVLTEGEDCLTLNIWAPSITRPQNAAVLIWIYGGGFQFGATALKVYNGSNFVRDSDDLIIVTFNYRLNIFGAPHASQLVSSTDSQNFGVLDQKAAIDWVKDNIAAFGGDPDRITIWGHSGGSIAVEIYTQAYPNDTIVKGVILQSGSYLNNTSPTFNSAPWTAVANAVGCGSEATPAQFTCMKATPAETLVQAARDGNIFFGLVFDNIILHSDWAARMAAGNFLKVPTLIGTVQHEADPIVVGGELDTRGTALPFITTARADISGQLSGTCWASRTAAERVNNGVATWRYQYHAIFPGISTRQDLRSFHGSDLPLIFGTFASVQSDPAPTATERLLSLYVKNVWSKFARNPGSGLTNFGWPPYNPSADTLVHLGSMQNPDGMKLGSPSLLDATCSHATELFGVLERLTNISNSIP